MLGRLEMNVDECISAYNELMRTVFDEESSGFPAGRTVKPQAQFDSKRLQRAIEVVITRHGARKTDLFNDGIERRCKSFVCAIAHETMDLSFLRSYSLPDELDIRATICQAALATLAATTFFEPISIGARKFADGGLCANNPVDVVEVEAFNIWCSENGYLKPLVKCFVSIGTGNPGKKAIEDSKPLYWETVERIVKETETTEMKFIARWRQQFDENRYFRFNVEQGLQDIGLVEYEKQGAIEAATYGYLTHTERKFRMRDCILNLRQKQRLYVEDFT